MTTGIVTSVSPHNGSGTLTADVLTGATVLPLDDAEPFAEDFSEPRFLVIGAEMTPREYVATANDEDAQESVTLAVPLEADFEADLPVTPWDPTVVAEDKRAVTHAVWVRLDGQDGAIRATVPHELIPLSGVDSLVGASVGLLEDPMTGWLVEAVYGRPAVVDGTTIDSPSVGIYALLDSLTMVASTWHPVPFPTSGQGNRHFPPVSGDRLTINKTGRYLIIGNVRWDIATDGYRWARIVEVDPDDTVHIRRMTQVRPSTTGASQFQVVTSRVIAAGQRIGFEVRHDSATSIGIQGDSDGEGTALEVTYISEL